jgi:hypothetical protein
MAASLTIMKALFGVASGGSSAATAATLPNALTMDPKEAVAGTDTAYVDLDLGAAYDLDTFYVGNLSAAAFSSLQLWYGATFQSRTTQAPSALAVAAAGVRNRQAFVKLATPINTRYPSFRFGLTAPAAWSAGLLAVGDSIQPTWGHEWGAGRSVDDRSPKDTLISGGFGVDKRAVVPQWGFTVGDLTDAELDSLWDMVADVGASSPVVVCEDPSLAMPLLNKATHYGLFERPEAYERLVPGASRWSFKVTEWN